VFEIGNSLREARLRQGLEFPRVEAETKIRGKYLRALEEEQFELLPGETYVKGFLRTYAEYLGLDGQLYVDEYNSRFTTEEEPVVSQAASRRPPRRRIESNFVVVALAGIVAVTVLVAVALTGLGGQGDEDVEPNLTSAEPTTTQKAEKPAAGQPKAQRPAARRTRLVLTASRGPCWMSVWAASASGKRVGTRPLYEGTLEEGQTQRFVKRALWIELGNPANLNARLNGRRVRSFPEAQSVVVVTPRGVRTVSTV
jgi:cytoskeleton protein RodZ